MGRVGEREVRDGKGGRVGDQGWGGWESER